MTKQRMILIADFSRASERQRRKMVQGGISTVDDAGSVTENDDDT